MFVWSYQCKLSEFFIFTSIEWNFMTAKWRNFVITSSPSFQVWNLETGKRLVTLRNHSDGVTCLQFNDFIIVSGSYDKTVKLWDFSSCWWQLQSHLQILLNRNSMSVCCQWEIGLTEWSVKCVVEVLVSIVIFQVSNFSTDKWSNQL